MEIEKARKEIEHDDNSEDGVGRSYECNYCKRGFTNAQALGGHMNIHRKDKDKAKAKAKAKHHPTYFSSFSNSIISCKNNIGQPLTFCPNPNLAPQRDNYQACYNYHRNNTIYNYDYPHLANNYNPRSFSSSSQPSIYFGNENLGIGRSEPLGADLSLRSNVEDSNENNYDAIDLELRLGYDP